MEDYLVTDVLRFRDGPAWRIAQAQALAEGPRPPWLMAEEGLVGRAAAYLREAAQGEEGRAAAAVEFPEIATAVALGETPCARQQLMILTIAGCPAEQIAARLAVREETITAAQLLFLDIGPSSTAMNPHVHRLISGEERAGNWDLAVQLRLAFLGGPVVAEALLDGAERLPQDKAQRLFDEKLLLHVKAQEAFETPLKGEREVVAYWKAFMNYKLKTERLEFEREKFRAACEVRLRKDRAQAAKDQAAKDQAAKAPGRKETKSPRPHVEGTRPGRGDDRVDRRGDVDVHGPGEAA